jgi:predicted  nucleic acid-binding Zn-ribbon protein
MVQADELTANVKKAEADLSAEQKAVDADRRTLASDRTDLTSALARMAAERTATVAGITPQVLAIFDLVAKRRHGVAVAEARDGICTICHVRLRPQVFNTVRRNVEIIQCDSCQRILYFAGAPAPAPAASDGGTVAR